MIEVAKIMLSKTNQQIINTYSLEDMIERCNLK